MSMSPASHLGKEIQFNLESQLLGYRGWLMELLCSLAPEQLTICFKMFFRIEYEVEG